MHLLLSCVVFVLAVVSFGNAQIRDCTNTGNTCREGCLNPNGEFQWCGSCEYYIVCTDGVPSVQACPEGLVWNDNAKLCVANSPTCTQCITPFAHCLGTGQSCIVDCLTYPDGIYQWCGRCDYFLQCSGGTTFFTKCQTDTLEYDDSFKACISASTTCFDDPCADGPTTGDCSSNPCYNGGTCEDIGDGYICICPPAYTGQQCLSIVDTCGSIPCLNGGTCYPLVGDYICTCPVGWTGDRCQTPINSCVSEPCLNGGTCQGGVGGIWTCICPPQYTGPLCQTLEDHCHSNPCQNGGTCHNNCDEHICDCPPGYTGHFCTEFVDNCASNPCLHDGTCNNGLNQWTCTCTPSFTGIICETPVQPCSSNPCQNGATCVHNCGDYQCLCPDGYTGQRCETSDVDPCYSRPCLNGGTCIPTGEETFTCSCPPEWTGSLCQSENYVMTCGDLNATNYPAKNGFDVFCFFWAPSANVSGRNTECRYAFNKMPIWPDSASLLNDGGNFGCIVSQNYPGDNDATSQISCDDYYQHSVTLGQYEEDARIMICIRYPYEGIPQGKEVVPPPAENVVPSSDKKVARPSRKRAALPLGKGKV